MSLIVLRALALVQMLYYTFRLLTVGLLVNSRVSVPSDFSYKAWMWKGPQVLAEFDCIEDTIFTVSIHWSFFSWVKHALMRMWIPASILVVLRFLVLFLQAMRIHGRSDILSCCHLCHFSVGIPSVYCSQGLDFLWK